MHSATNRQPIKKNTNSKGFQFHGNYQSLQIFVTWKNHNNTMQEVWYSETIGMGDYKSQFNETIWNYRSKYRETIRVGTVKLYEWVLVYREVMSLCEYLPVCVCVFVCASMCCACTLMFV